MYIDTAHSGIVHGGTVLGGGLPSGTALPVAAGPPEKAGPDYGVGVFREITQWAAGTPEWMQKLGELVTEGGILVFVALFVLQWWRARRGDDRTMALALLGPVAVAAVYALSEIIKVWLHEERPCRDIPGVTVIAQCPEPGDWSFPSNHSVIAAASALALLFSWRLIGLLALPLAALIALSRVYVGVHYLHDVAAGFLLGAVLAPLMMAALAGPGTRAVGRFRRSRGRHGAGMTA
ncbi:phosphatase PAP2 family protein [Streptomyces sp. NBC_00654]|uniref:phosphatase PAP2 family protein n=1 Tax=Streptomyces sp. NBC_00654 TaxID=2975799 RepID=UPI00224FCFC3|nr:phosphatase PAP2 family protein [Streptomyces sp. NBC_00654]MCX4963444.1 phosphatase PAP2 family protein [Streptomyces sp. NBC_00654]